MYSNDTVSCDGCDLEQFVRGDVTVYSRSLTKEEQEQLITANSTGELNSFLGTFTKHHFVAILVDAISKKIVVINDFFGSNEIFYVVRNGLLWITDDLPLLFKKSHIQPEINIYAAYEHLAFYTICPPRTIFNGIAAVPMGSFVQFDAELHARVYEYGNIASLLSQKEMSYVNLVNELSTAIGISICKDVTTQTAIALSGGIDSGGLLGLLKSVTKITPPSLSIGPHGEASSDLKSAKLTAQELGSSNTALYPSLEIIQQIPVFVSKLNQPIIADVLIPNAQLLDEAQKQGCTELVFGSGSEMLLGSLSFGRVAYYMRIFERIIPRLIVHLVYSLYVSLRNISQNKREFLFAPNWASRFLHVRASLFTRERAMYRLVPNNFLTFLEQSVAKTVPPSLRDSGDDVVLMYVRTWENYLQLRDVGAIAKMFNIVPVMPFDTQEVASVLFKTPTRFRKKNGWDKKLIRDAFRPYVSERLVIRKGKSLVIPYTTLLASCKNQLLEYLRSSVLISQLVNIDLFEKQYEQLPEPGLTLIRLVGLATWYDSHFDMKHLALFPKLT